MSKTYSIYLEPRAEKELGKVPADAFSKIDKIILSLSKNPRPFGVKKLDEDVHRVRVGDWRVLFAILDAESRIVILRVARRSEKTYKNN